MTKNTIARFLQKNPQYRERKYIPMIVQEFTGVSPRKQVDVKVATQRLQEMIPIDSKGKTMESEWRDENYNQPAHERRTAELVRDMAWPFPRHGLF